MSAAIRKRRGTRRDAAAPAHRSAPTLGETTASKLIGRSPEPQLADEHDPVSRAADVTRETGQALSESERNVFEPRFGRDLSGIRLHTDRAAGRAATEIGARAYTLGQHIAFAPGEYRPAAREGRRLVAHELVHALQQRQVGEGKTLQRQIARGDLRDYEMDMIFERTDNFQDFVAEVQRWLAGRVKSRSENAHRERILATPARLRPIYSLLTPGQGIRIRVHFETDLGWKYDRVHFILGDSSFVVFPPEPQPEEQQEQDTPRRVIDFGSRERQHRVREAQIGVVERFLDPGIGSGDIREIIAATPVDSGEHQDATALSIAVLACTIAEFSFSDNDDEVFNSAFEYVEAVRRTGHPRARRTSELMREALAEVRDDWRLIRREIVSGRNSQQQDQPNSRVFSNRNEYARNIVAGYEYGESIAIRSFASAYVEDWASDRSFERRIRNWEAERANEE